MTQNPFKQALAERRRQIGIWNSLCSPLASELIAAADFDWMLIDTEHSPIEISGVMPLLQAAASGKVHPMVRVEWNDSVIIKRALDIGARSLLVPFVQNAEEAENAARSCRYPPQGIRGVAGSTRAGSYGRDKTYHATANDGVCLCVQAETETAIANVGAIAAVDGVDGVFIGPSDLAASMGHLGNPGHDAVQLAIASGMEAIHGAGKAAGILSTKHEETERYLALGFDFVAVGNDTSMLVRAVDELAARYRG